jgi:hypothetical protein
MIKEYFASLLFLGILYLLLHNLIALYLSGQTVTSFLGILQMPKQEFYDTYYSKRAEVLDSLKDKLLKSLSKSKLKSKELNQIAVIVALFSPLAWAFGDDYSVAYFVLGFSIVYLAVAAYYCAVVTHRKQLLTYLEPVGNDDLNRIYRVYKERGINRLAKALGENADSCMKIDICFFESYLAFDGNNLGREALLAVSKKQI